MAQYELTSPDGRRFRVTAPDDMDEQSVLQRFTREVGQPVSPRGRPVDPAIDAAARRRQEATTGAEQFERIDPTAATIGDTVTFGAFPQIMGAGRVALGRLLGTRDRNLSFTDDYAQERDIIRRQIDLERERLGPAATIPLDLMGAVATGRPDTAAATVAAAVPSMGRRILESAGWGAGLAGAYGFNRETGTWGEKLASAGEHAVGGAAVGAALPPVISGVARAGNALMSTLARPFSGGGRGARQEALAREWEQAMPGTTIPPVVLAESPTLQATGRGAANSVLGGPLQQDVRRGAETLERGVRQEVTGGNPVLSPAEAGQQSQDVLRRQMLEHTRSSAELDAMARADLERIAHRGEGESVPTQMGARYRLAEQTPVEGYGTAGDIRGNFMDNLPARAGGPTETYRLLTALGQEERQAGRLPGWRDGDMTSPAFWNAMDARLGPEVSALLHAESTRRTSSQINLTLPGLRDQRTMVRRVLQDLENSNPGQTATADIAALQRLHGSMTSDLQRMMLSAGPGGPAAAVGYARADHTYRQFIEGMRQPLRRLFGDNVTPNEAFKRLAAATQHGTENAQLLDSFFRALETRGTAGQAAGEQAVRSLLAPALEGGLPGFLQFLRNLTPDARRIMSRHTSGTSLQALERFGRLAERLEPYLPAVSNPRGVNLSSMTNLALAAGLVHNLFGALAGAGGVHLLSRFMASPRYLRWLTDAPGRSRGGINSERFKDWVNQLQAITGDDAATGQAVMQALGSALGSAAPPAQATFVGENSQAADQQALARARDMQRQGASMEDIRRETGWFEQDDRWWTEVNDRPFAQSGDRARPDGNRTAPFFNHFTHPEILQHYPQLQDNLMVGGGTGRGVTGGFSEEPGGPTVRLPGNDYRARPHIPLHELQHAIDLEEGVDAEDYRGLPIERDPSEARARSAEQRRLLTDEERRNTGPPIQFHAPSGNNPPPMMRLGGPPEQPVEFRESAGKRPRDFRDETFWERLSAPARGIAGTIARTIEEIPPAFNRLLQYQPGTGDEQAPVDAFTLASIAATGAAPTAIGARATGATLGTFIGRVGAENLAQAGRPTALRVLEMAERLEQRGQSEAGIRAAANRVIEQHEPALGGVSRGADGMWRLELDDSASQLTRTGQGPAREILQHDELYAAHPDTGNVATTALRGSEDVGFHTPGRIALTGTSPSSTRTTLLHELGHEVQGREGFATGANSRTQGDRAYVNSAGEVEARNVEFRADFTPQERRDVHPRRTEDVPRRDQIVTRDSTGSEARPRSSTWNDERLTQLQQMWREGLEARDIASRMGMSEDAINIAVHRYRSELRLGYRRNDRPQEMLDTVRSMHADNRSTDEIARAIGHSAPLVRRVFAELGLQPRPRVDPNAAVNRQTRRQAETQLDRRSLTLERDIIAAEDRLRRAGKTPEQIAAELNQRLEHPVTAEDIRTGNVWWRVGSEKDFGRELFRFNEETNRGNALMDRR